MELTVGTYNVNNLFERASLFQLPGFSTKAAAVLNDITALDDLLENASYQGAVGTKIVKLLDKYFHKSKSNQWFTINEVRGQLFGIRKGGGVFLKAKGRADWLGWTQLNRENVDEASTENTARVIGTVGAGLLCVVEVEDRITLDNFNHSMVKNFRTPYAHSMSIEGNDPRGINVGVLSDFEIIEMRSHVDDTYTTANGKHGKVFSRDCVEYHMNLGGGKSLWLLCNHLKSKGYGQPQSNDARRKAQAERVVQILQRFDLAKDSVIVAGDFNDTPNNPPLQPLLTHNGLHDVLKSTLVTGPTYTYEDGKSQLDYLLVSTPIHKTLKAVGVERRGIFMKGSQHFPDVTSKINQGSDHAAVWATFTI